jgi:hypothetical protein
LERAFKKQDFELMKIVKNILKFSDDENVNETFENFIDGHFMKILISKSEISDFLLEIIEVLSNIDTDWSKILEKFKLIEFFEKHLKDGLTKSTEVYNQILLAIILFFGNIAANRV